MHFSNLDALGCNSIQDTWIKDKTFWDSGVKVDRSQFLFYFVPLESEAQAQLAGVKVYNQWDRVNWLYAIFCQSKANDGVPR